MPHGFLFLLLLPFVNCNYEYGVQCRQLECLSKDELLTALRSYQDKEHHIINSLSSHAFKRKTPSIFSTFDGDTTCNICSSSPCQNGGTCQIDPTSPWNKYLCQCPGTFKGENCEIPIVCKNDTCGPNAKCYVSNHQTNCICPVGYSGNASDPQSGCTFKTVSACASGDPHFTTFDQLHFDYMGTCPIIYSQPCTTLNGSFVDYSVRYKAELIGNGHVSTITQTEITMYGQKIHLDRSIPAIFFNGIQVNYPYYWPSQEQITITYPSSTFTVVNNQFITVTFDTSGQLCVYVPDVQEFHGASTLCGLAGNIDGNPLNDVVYRNGTVYLLPNAKTNDPRPDDSFLFNQCEDTWITTDFMNTSGAAECVRGVIMSNNTNCTLMPAVETCSPIQQAMNGTGLFAMCQNMGISQLQMYYDNCVFDICQQDTLKCSYFTTFVKACQSTLPNTDVGPWRNAMGCQWICQTGSHYSSCTSSCPATCADQTRPDTCNQGCFEGCECNPGSVIDNTNLLATTCIPVESCGCTDPDGNLHGANSLWLDKNCTISAACVNGTYTSKPTQCAEYGYCGTDSDYHMTCKCLSGFQGDGYICTDIDECQDPNSCSAGKGLGNCTNTLGSYNCTCNPYQVGRDCQTYKPARHCADLLIYWNIKTDGPQTIYPPYALRGMLAYNPVEVYCDMTTFGGGWTLLSHDSGMGMSNRTYSEYVTGFGTGTDRWLGLDFVHMMTFDQNMSLLLHNITRCGYGYWGDAKTDCTYPLFKVFDSNNSYAVYIPQGCTGSDKQYTGAYDGWIQWDPSQLGPAFSTFDNDNTASHCSSVHANVGFWFGVGKYDLCGVANLNGFRTDCSQPPPSPQQTGGLNSYLKYGGVLIGDVWMYLRPVDYVPPTTVPPPPEPTAVGPTVPPATVPPPPEPTAVGPTVPPATVPPPPEPTAVGPTVPPATIPPSLKPTAVVPTAPPPPPSSAAFYQ